MKSIKSILGFALGGIAAITGLGSLISGCSEDATDKPVVKISQADLEKCCGTDKQSASYNSCVANYQRNGVCSGSGGTIDHGVQPLYGVQPVIDSASKQACCGTDYTSKTYEDCVNKMYKACPANSQKELDQCIANYKEVNSCSVEPPPQTDYGMPPYINPDDSDACCGTNYTSKAYKDCVNKMVDACPASSQEKLDACIAEYRKVNACDDIMVPEYGMPVPELDPKDAEACCGTDIGSPKYEKCIQKMFNDCPQESQKEFDACIANYKEVNSCSVEPPPQTDYGMPGLMDEDVEECCGPNDNSKEYKACFDKMFKACADANDYGKCITEYKKANHCGEIAVPEYGVQPVDPNPQDILDCCGPATDSPKYDACVKELTKACGDADDYGKCMADYKAVNHCGEIAVPEYGMLPVIDPKDAEACCGSDTTSKDYQKCVQKMYDECPAKMGMSQKEFNACIDNYKEVNSCSVEPPPQTD